jgi:hypothetical protein
VSQPSRLLRRQLRTLFPDGPPTGLEPLLDLVGETYARFEADRELLERSLVLSSDELLASNAELRGMLQALPDLILTLDCEGRLLTWHVPVGPGAFTVAVPEGVQGRRLTEIVPKSMRAGLETALERIRAGAGIERLEYTIDVAGEERFREGRLVSLPVGQVLCIVRDVTDLRRAEAALRRSEAHYRLLFDANPQPMWVFDRETLAFLAVNEAAIAHYGWSRAEFLAMRATDIRPPEEVPALLDLMGRLEEGPMRPGVFRHHTREGRLIDVETLGNPLVFYGRPAIMVLANDVTEQKRLEDQIRQTQRMEAVGQLAGGVAHDFNNLLTVISGYSEMLLASLTDRDADLRRVHEIHRAAARAASLTRQLLAFSRKQMLEPRVLDLDEVVQGMAPMLERLLGEHITLETPRARGLGAVRADRGQIEQVVMNLAINARDAMPGGGTVTIELSDVTLQDAGRGSGAALRTGPHVMLSVRDDGCGMDAATRDRIFEPFFTTKEVGRGTGLGLATVYGIIQQSDGAIRVESQPGLGSTFRIYLPRVDEPAAAGDAGPDLAAAGRETVLLVEDEDVVRALEIEVLAARGYHVLAAADAREALALAADREGPIALLVTDVVMPGRSGRELAHEFLRRRPGTPVLYVSGYANDAFVSRGLLEGGSWFLQKPFSPEALAGKVREILDRGSTALAA